ncbi:nuclear transport factor 2 family protein [Brevundimonas sp. AJA228-03]|uniref:nuclear transport factor 2 family protein n=1 Tax=Brevundimonas sp. AJA228-03 TaxID=2752515 RepID=UPI001AE0D205|nr:nuclear transport factor 2 family protein [Brevundimonas sp. AJA228-03]QTN18598.1 nuclear transport factor 2 family protein [Brevundimonas sp. AJA228-03]
MSLVLAALAALTVRSATPEAEVAAVLDALNVASAAADADAYFALYAPDARFVGTDAGEHWTLDELRGYVGPYFARGQGWSYPATSRVVTIAPIECRCIAWFEEQLTNDTYGRTRGSGVMRLTDGGWKIEQYVLSLAVPNDLASPIARIIRTYEAAKEAPAP